MKSNKGDLISLLKNTQRNANINGKMIPQVLGCIIECWDEVARTVMVVRDGKTSISSFSMPCSHQDAERIIIPNIEKVIGALKAHSEEISILQTDDKIRILSGKKSTTLVADQRALAFPHTTDTLKDWQMKAQKRFADACLEQNMYKMASGEMRMPFLITTIAGGALRSALDAGNINGQKVSRYSFKGEGGGLYVTVGNEMSGETTILLDDCNCEFEAVFEGGFENIDINTPTMLSFVSFKEEDAGFGLIIDYGCGLPTTGIVFQRSIL